MAVMKTPKVDNMIPFHKTGRMVFQSVSRPPENRMNMSAEMPMNWAMAGLSKYMPPMPSEPAMMPTTRKKRRVGTPSLADVLPAKMLSNSRIEEINKILPGVIAIFFQKQQLCYPCCKYSAMRTGHFMN